MTSVEIILSFTFDWSFDFWVTLIAVKLSFLVVILNSVFRPSGGSGLVVGIGSGVGVEVFWSCEISDVSGIVGLGLSVWSGIIDVSTGLIGLSESSGVWVGLGEGEDVGSISVDEEGSDFELVSELSVIFFPLLSPPPLATTIMTTTAAITTAATTPMIMNNFLLHFFAVLGDDSLFISIWPSSVCSIRVVEILLSLLSLLSLYILYNWIFFNSLNILFYYINITILISTFFFEYYFFILFYYKNNNYK